MNKSHDSIRNPYVEKQSRTYRPNMLCPCPVQENEAWKNEIALLQDLKTNALLPSVSKTYLFFEQVPTCQCSGGEKGVVIRRLLKQKTWLRLVGCNRKSGSGVWRSEILDWECQGPDQEEVNFNTQQRRALRAVKRKREEVEAKLQVRSKMQFY